MKIHHIRSVQMNVYQANERMQHEQKRAETKKDQVEISQEAKALLKEEEIPKERMDKIQAIKEQIENGTYQINTKEVARKLYEYYNESF